MFKKLISFFFPQEEVEDDYPFHPAMREDIPNAYAPLLVMDFVREVMEIFNAGMTEAEIILLLLARDGLVPITEIMEQTTHVTSAEHIGRLMRSLTLKGVALKVLPDDLVISYRITDAAKIVIRSIYKA